MKGEMKTISLDDIVNYNDNPRHSVANNELETWKNLFDKVGDQYMVNLAEDIFNNNLLPIDIITVVYSEENNKYIVYEGNRRVSCIKLLTNPDSFTFLDTTIINKIKKITSSGFKHDFSKIQAYVTDEEEGFYIMEKVHTGEDQGRGRKPWTPREKDIFKSRRNNAKTMPLLIDEYVRKYKNNFDITLILAFTTIDRIFNNRDIRQKIGLDIADETTFTSERIDLVIHICKKSAEKAKIENQGVTRIFNKARVIEDIVLPWIEEYFSIKDNGNDPKLNDSRPKDPKPDDPKPDDPKPNNSKPNDLNSKDPKPNDPNVNITNTPVDVKISDVNNPMNLSNFLLKESINLKEGSELYLKSSEIISNPPNEVEILKNSIFSMNEKYIFESTNPIGEYEVEYLYNGNTQKLKIIVEKSEKLSSNNFKGTGGKDNLPYFFSGLEFGHINPNEQDTHGVSRTCNELKTFTSKKYVYSLPIASAFLVRSIIEQSLILYSKRNKIQGQEIPIWRNISRDDKPKQLSSIIDNFNKNLPNYISDTNIRDYFSDLFSDYNKHANPLNWVVHRPDQFVLDPKRLETLPSQGLLTLINYLIKKANIKSN